MHTPPLALRSLPCRSHQTGATLIVGLVLLLVLTVVGISGMNTATMEIAMAANSQFQQEAFQAAEDAIDLAIGRRDYTTEEVRTIAALGTPEHDRWSTTRYVCNTNAAGFTAPDFNAFQFETVSAGRAPRGAPSTHTQGFYVVANGLPTAGGC